MAEYAVELKRSAEKELENLPSAVLGRVIAKLERLANEPRPDGCVKLKGSDGFYRIRIGDYRAIYEVDDRAAVVSVTRIRHRSEVYE